MELYNITVDSEENFFKGLIQNRATKTVGVILSIILTLCTSLSLFGIIWFERFGSDLKRMFINRAVSSLCWTILVYFTIIQVSDILFYFDIPFPKLYCYTYLMLRNAFTIQVILHLDSIIVIRYIFIFWLKNPMNFQDDFWCVFINLWVVVARICFKKHTFQNYNKQCNSNSLLRFFSD